MFSHLKVFFDEKIMCQCFEFGSLQLLADKTNNMQTLEEVISNINSSI